MGAGEPPLYAGFSRAGKAPGGPDLTFWGFGTLGLWDVGTFGLGCCVVMLT